MWDVWGAGELHIRLWWECMKGKGHMEDPSVDGRIILKWNYKNIN
jgi:hypothetical protein